MSRVQISARNHDGLFEDLRGFPQFVQEHADLNSLITILLFYAGQTHAPESVVMLYQRLRQSLVILRITNVQFNTAAGILGSEKHIQTDRATDHLCYAKSMAHTLQF